jgi:hypothetical protein
MKKGLVFTGVILFSFIFFTELNCMKVQQLTAHEMLQPQDFTARTYGMGGMMVTARGAEAVFLNPAGMAVNPSGNVEMVLTTRAYVMGRPPTYDDKVYEENYGIDNFSCKFPFHSSYISNIGVYAPYQFKDSDIGIAGGIAWRRYYDLGGKMTQEYEDYYGEHNVEMSLSSGLNFLTIAGAVAYQNKYSGGLAIGFPFMSNHNGDSTYEVAEQDYKSVTSEEGDVSGSFLRLGVVGQPTEMLMFDLAYTLGFDMEVEDIEWERNISDAGYEYSYEGTSSDVEFENPSFLIIGVAFMPNDIVTIGFEYQNRPWEDYKADNVELSDDNGFSLRLGGDLNLGAISLRGGYIMDKLWWIDEDKDLVTIHTPTFGIGFGGEAYSFDISMGYGMATYDGTLGDVKYNLLTARAGFSYVLPWKFQ